MGKFKKIKQKDYAWILARIWFTAVAISSTELSMHSSSTCKNNHFNI